MVPPTDLSPRHVRFGEHFVGKCERRLLKRMYVRVCSSSAGRRLSFSAALTTAVVVAEQHLEGLGFVSLTPAADKDICVHQAFVLPATRYRVYGSLHVHMYIHRCSLPTYIVVYNPVCAYLWEVLSCHAIEEDAVVRGDAVGVQAEHEGLVAGHLGSLQRGVEVKLGAARVCVRYIYIYVSMYLCMKHPE